MNNDQKTANIIHKIMADADGYITRHLGPNRHQVRSGTKKLVRMPSGRGWKETGKSGGTKIDRADKRKKKIAKSSVQRNRLTKTQRNVRRNSLRKAARGKKA